MTFDEDARTIVGIAAGDPSFRDAGAEAMDRAQERLMRAAGGPADGFRLEAMRLMALGRNGHTRAIANDAVRVVPFRFVWLSDGPCLVAGPDPALEGASVETVNDLGIDEVFAGLRPYLAGTDQRARAIAGMMLAWPPALAAATGRAGEPDYGLRLPGGAQVPLRAMAGERVPATELYAVRERGVADALIEAAGLAGAGPFARRLDGVAYVRIGDLSALPREEMAGRLRALLAEVEGAEGAVVDLRGNPGGDFTGAAEFAAGLAGRLRGARRVAAAVDRFTFSAALVTAALLKIHAGAKLVGEEMGDAAKFWAEGGLTELPQSGLAIRHCDGWHDWETGVPDPVLTPSSFAHWMAPAGDLLPDVPVPLTAADFAARRDPVLAAARRWASGG